MSDIPAALTHLVVERARGRCEYCGLSQLGQEATFHVDRVVPRAVAGPTTAANLAIACVSCSLRKGARLAAEDRLSGDAIPLFNPRLERWQDHFRWDGIRVEGLTPVGRCTVAAKKMTRPLILAIRGEETVRGRHPPPAS